MAKALNKSGKDIIFLAEYTHKTSADALLMFKGKYTIADFKYFTTTKANTIAEEFKNTFKETPTIVMKMEKSDVGTLKNAVDMAKRKNFDLGNIILVNKYGKALEISEKDIKIGKHIILLKGFL